MPEKIGNLIYGLKIIRDRVTGISFYNSSGGDAVFYIDAPLTPLEEKNIKELGFEYSWYGNRGSVSFPE